MTRKKYSDEIEYETSSIDLKAYHKGGENGCSFLKLDYEEHPDLERNDLDKLGQLLIEKVEEYLKEKKGAYVLEEHSSSYHVLHDGDIIAKIWHNDFANSQIKNSDGAKRVAEEFVKVMNGRKTCSKMPKLEEGSSCSSLFYRVVDGCIRIASFKNSDDAERYIEEFVLKKYNQRIQKKKNVVKLINSRGSGDTITLYLGFGQYPLNKAENILYHLREFIHDYIEEVR